MTDSFSIEKFGQTLLRLTGAGTTLVGLSCLSVQPALAVTAAGGAEATIVAAGVPSVAQIDSLNFGDIIFSGSGTVVISPAGVPTLLGGVAHTPSSPHQQGLMRITGNPAAVVDVNITTTSYTVTNGTAFMTVSAFDLGAGPGNMNSLTIGGGSTVDVNIGATLIVGTAQPQGNYTGTFTLNTDYQ